MRASERASDPVSELPRLDGFADLSPEEVIAAAREAHDPIASFCLTSGGNDSSVLAHRCRDHYDELVHIDTGTALPGVREFVESQAERMGKPLRVLESGDAFEKLVLELGFLGPAQHNIAYTRLKERRIYDLLRDVKRGHPRTAKVMLLTGTRRHESVRRMKNHTALYRAIGGQLWVNPIMDWTDKMMRAYREEHALPESDVAAITGRSGECGCGCFSAPGEREMLRDLWPEWFRDNIERWERLAQEAGLASCRWGERPRTSGLKDGREVHRQLELCTSCMARQGLADSA